MMMTKAMDDIQKKLLRKFHTLCAQAGMNEYEKRAVVESYGVESSADIDTHDLIDICNSLARQIAGKKGAEMDTLRKRVIAAIGGYLRSTQQTSNIDIIKGIACRATGHDNFNKIPAERLRNIYNTFRNKQKDAASISAITDSIFLQAIPQSTNSTSIN